MKFYFAPLEGITGYLYRNAHYEMFPQMDRYYTPFVSPTSSFNFKSREKKDVVPEHNEGIPVVPQILTNKSEDFIYTANCLFEYGYKEINLNLGCPSGTVAPKGRGAGFLRNLDGLDRFLDEIYSQLPFSVSVKTRLGMEDAAEFYKVLEIYNKYPISELTIHPRVRQDFYKNTPNLDMFEWALEHSKNPICYNGDINTVEDYERFTQRFPSVESIMIGRGLITNPGLVREIKTGEKIREEEMFEFVLKLEESYKEIMANIPVLYKLKEVWSYMSRSFPDREKLWKKIKKTKKLEDYDSVLQTLKSVL